MVCPIKGIHIHHPIKTVQFLGSALSKTFTPKACMSIEIDEKLAFEIMGSIADLMDHYSPDRYRDDRICEYCGASRQFNFNTVASEHVRDIDIKHTDDCSGASQLAALGAHILKKNEPEEWINC